MLEELKEKYTKIALWFFALLTFISLLAHYSLSSLVEEETAPQEDNEQVVKIYEAMKKAEQEQQPQVQNEPPQEQIQEAQMQQPQEQPPIQEPQLIQEPEQNYQLETNDAPLREIIPENSQE